MTEEDEINTVGFRSYTYKGIPIMPAPQWYIDMLKGQMTINPKKDIPLIPPDLDFCGLGEANTGPNDPWYKRGVCQAHDEHFTKLDKGEYATFGEFAKGIVRGMAEGAYMLVSGIPYLLIGGILGIFRQQQLENRAKNTEGDDDVLGDDV